MLALATEDRTSSVCPCMPALCQVTWWGDNGSQAGPVQPNLPPVTSLSSKERSQMTIAHLVPDVRPEPIKFLLFPHITLAPHSGALRVLRVTKLLAQGDIACQECR